MRRIEINSESLKLTKPHEYAMRFLFGGLCTAIAGWITSRFGPVIGGLFLAFPAIFPAGASLIESHEKARKAEVGADGTVRGRMAASLDAAGATVGCAALFAFAFTLYKILAGRNAYLTITLACCVWALVAYSGWLLWSNRRRVAR